MYEFCEWVWVWRCTTAAAHKLQKKQIIFYVYILINDLCILQWSVININSNI